MPNHVLIVDYGVGNLLSVRRAFEHCGATVELSGDPARLERASRVVLPGVGAFGDCVAALRACGLAEAIRHYVSTGRPFQSITRRQRRYGSIQKCVVKKLKPW